MMMIIYLLLVIINLTMMKCSSTGDQKVIEDIYSETPSTFDIFSRHLDEQLLHKVLEYDAKSTGRMAKANRALHKLAVGSRTFRYFEGAGWDMPELANIREFSRNRPRLKAEMDWIMALSHIKDEDVFIETLETFLLKHKVFKELSGPVLNYLVRRLYERTGDSKYGDREIWKKYLMFAVEFRLYDAFFELSKDKYYWGDGKIENIIKGEIHDCFFFDCYNNHAFNYPYARKYMWSRIADIKSWDYMFDRFITLKGEKVYRNEVFSWIASCIYRRVPKEKYVPYLSKKPETFLDIIQEFIFKYSPITFDNDEKEYFHEFIVRILDMHFAKIKNLEDKVIFTKLLNDVRFGNVNESFFEDRILPFDKIKIQNKIEMLIMAASKANNKLLVKQLAHHHDFFMIALSLMVELKNPHSFKVYFDMFEGGVLHEYCFCAIMLNKFKVTKVVTANFVNKVEIQSPIEYVKLAFYSKTEIIFDLSQDQDILIPIIRSFVEKMFYDAASSSAEEFIQVVTEHCGDHVVDPNFIHFQSFEVPYEAIQILIQHIELIEMLANRSVKLLCSDERIKQDEIARFRYVINPKND